jgi:hypothetical protein
MTQVGRFVPLGSICARPLLLFAAVLLLAATSFAQIAEDSVVTLTANRSPVSTPPVTQSFIISPPPGGAAAAIAVLIMLPGRDGNIQLAPNPLTPGDGTLDVNSGNFLVRTRWDFAAQGFVVLTLDSATDFQNVALYPTGLEGQQSNPNHIADVLQVISYARSIPDLPANTPVWVVGTSRGTAGAWVAGGNPCGSPAVPPNPSPVGPDGLVFTSPVNDAGSTTVTPTGCTVTGDVDSLLAAPLGSITVPTLLFNNKMSTCTGALASGDPAVLKLLTAAPVKANQNVNDATFPALSSGCESLSPHGYFGDEPDVVTKVSTWIISPS